MLRLIRIASAAALIASASAAQATTVIIYVEPMTMERYTRVLDTPGPDRAVICPAPPATGTCTEIPVKPKRQATASNKPSNSRRPSAEPWAGSTARSG